MIKKRYSLSVGRLELTAFIIGFCLLSYELVAARLLAPYIGSSIYVWTSVIGVIILALSFGYAFGGWLADKRVKTTDVALLLLLAAGGVGATMVTYSAVLGIVITVIEDPRLQGLAASLVLFAPTSFVLGSISPYLARLKLKSITTTGRVIASLSAINSLGGISGTLITGFILLGYIGSNQILLLLMALLIIFSWIVMPRGYLKERAVISLALAGSGFFALASPLQSGVIADINTASANYRVQEVGSAQAPFRVLVSGPGAWQSGSLKNGSNELVFWYTQKIADVVQQAPKHDSILILGGGAFSLPRYFSEKYPEAQITVVEIDPELAVVAEEYFYYKPAQNITTISEDARAFLQKNNKTYDIIVVDAFSDTNVPFTLVTKEYAAALKQATHSSSQVVVNLIVSTKGACGELFAGINASYKESFGHAAYFPHYKDNLTQRQNVVAVYARQPLASLDQSIAPIFLPDSQGFSDNFSPNDRLHFACKLEA